MKTLAELPHGWFFYCPKCDKIIGYGIKTASEFQRAGKEHVIQNPEHEVWMLFNDKLWSQHQDVLAAIVLS
jgi:Neuraminidase (sialidase)